MYVKTYGDGTMLDITLYVGNIFATTDADELAVADLKELNERFPGTLQENPEFFLGLNVKYQVCRARPHQALVRDIHQHPQGALPCGEDGQGEA